MLKREILMSILIGILNSLMVLGSLFMVCIILIQRGKGGGLAE
jgi:preprotein translocase subunit SecG